MVFRDHDGRLDVRLFGPGDAAGVGPVRGVVDLDGRRVGVIGTGSSGIQSIPIIAETAADLYVFQRTPNYVVPARNRPLSADDLAEIRAGYDELRARAKQALSAFEFERNADSAVAASPEERNARFERFWEIGGLPFLGVFGDHFQEVIRRSCHQVTFQNVRDTRHLAFKRIQHFIGLPG